MNNILKIFLCALLLLAVSLPASAAKEVTVTGEATYYDDGTRSRRQCMQEALNLARIDALAKEFGTIVEQDLIQTDRVSESREQHDFLSLSSTEVQGEWISDIGEPEYDINLDKDGNFIVTCRIKGKARAITNEASEFEAKVLRNAPMINAENTSFRHGDSMYLYFNGSVNGYVAVFLEDELGNVLQLLPYTTDTNHRFKVRKNKEYFFFSDQHHDRSLGQVDEIFLTAQDRTEINRLWVVFSPESFSRPVMVSDGGHPYTQKADFEKWLNRSRRHDSKMNVKTMNIEIIPQN